MIGGGEADVGAATEAGALIEVSGNATGCETLELTGA
jgi:hypothetical protein